MSPIRIALVGVGKIVRDQHAPVLAASPDFQLAGTASPHSSLDGTPAFKSLDELLSNIPDVDAVAVTSTTDVRHDIARAALAAGKHVLLEKPPCTTLSALDDLREQADGARLTLFASWHSRFAPQVEAARAWLAGRRPTAIEVVWREDVRRWHPGQDWIWEPGGLGVFDPGVNALSILTGITPARIYLLAAELAVPQGRQAPIAASLKLSTSDGAPVAAEFDWTGEGEQTWEIRVETAQGRLRLYDGGASLSIDGQPAPAPAAHDPQHAEYAGVYARFAELVRTGASEVDDRPLRLAADAFLAGRRTTAPPFVE